MRVAYFYFMKPDPDPDRVRAVAPRHAAYWQGLTLPNYCGGPFADRSGGLIVFDSDSAEETEDLVSRDPFLRERLLEHHWIKEWLADSAGLRDQSTGQRSDRAADEVTAEEVVRRRLPGQQRARHRGLAGAGDPRVDAERRRAEQ